MCDPDLSIGSPEDCAHRDQIELKAHNTQQKDEIAHLRDVIEKAIPMIDQDGKACRLLRAALEWEPAIKDEQA